jgi:hypothetical protein
MGGVGSKSREVLVQKAGRRVGREGDEEEEEEEEEKEEGDEEMEDEETEDEVMADDVDEAYSGIPTWDAPPIPKLNYFRERAPRSDHPLQYFHHA